MSRIPGYILLFRSIKDNWVWRDPEFLKAWIWLLLKANYEDRETIMSGNLVSVKRGELITSFNSICMETGLSMKRARTFIKNLEKGAMIRREKGGKWARIIICNYDSYQIAGQGKGTKGAGKRANRGQAEGTTLINSNELNERINALFESWWDAYDKKRGKVKTQKKWVSLTDSEREACMEHAPRYVKSTPDKSKRKDPLTYINGRAWEDEIIHPNTQGPPAYKKLNGNAKPQEPSLSPGYDPNQEILELNAAL